MSDKHSFKVGDVVVFKGYEGLESGQKPIFRKDDALKLVKKLDDESFEAEWLIDSKKKDTVFFTEISEQDSDGNPAKTDTEAKTDGSKKKLRVKKAGSKKAAAKKTSSKKATTKKASAKKTAAKATTKKASSKKASAKKTSSKATTKKASSKKATAKKTTPAKQDTESGENENDEQENAFPAESYSTDVVKLTKTDKSALKAATSLTERIAQTFWTLGGVLSFIQRNESFKVLKDEDGNELYSGTGGFKKYIADKLGMKYRRAMYYIEIYEAFARLGVDSERVLKIGWSKAKELTAVIDEDNVGDWLDAADSMGRDDLQSEIKEAMVDGGTGKGTGTSPRPSENPKKRTTFKFSVFEDQGNVTSTALGLAKEELGTDKDEEAFAHIMQEYVALHQGS